MNMRISAWILALRSRMSMSLAQISPAPMGKKWLKIAKDEKIYGDDEGTAFWCRCFNRYFNRSLGYWDMMNKFATWLCKESKKPSRNPSGFAKLQTWTSRNPYSKYSTILPVLRGSQLSLDAGESLLQVAQDGGVDQARKLLDTGTGPDAKDDSQSTPLHYAAKGRNPEVVSCFSSMEQIQTSKTALDRHRYITQPGIGKME